MAELHVDNVTAPRGWGLPLVPEDWPWARLWGKLQELGAEFEKRPAKWLIRFPDAPERPVLFVMHIKQPGRGSFFRLGQDGEWEEYRGITAEQLAMSADLEARGVKSEVLGNP